MAGSCARRASCFHRNTKRIICDACASAEVDARLTILAPTEIANSAAEVAAA